MSVGHFAGWASAALAVVLSGACASVDDEPAPLRVVTWNIHHGRGLDDRVDLDRVAEVIRAIDPDLVALQEVDVGTRRTDGLDLPAELGARCGMAHVFGRNIGYQGGGYGNAVLSRLRIDETRNLHYRMLREGEQRGALQVRVEVDGRRVVFVSTHLDYRPDDAERLSNLAELASLHEQWPGAIMILCGDLNAEPGSATIEKATRDRLDCWSTGDGEGFTYPADAARKRIDYVLVPAGGAATPLAARVVRTDASDHLPVVVDLRLP